MRAILYSVVICQSIVIAAAGAQSRRVADTPRSGTLTSIVDPTNVPETLPELITLSPVVIVATCQGESPSRFFVKGDLRSDLVTDRIVRVDEVLKGSVAPASVIAIEELGGSVSKYDGVHSLKQEIVHQRPLQPHHRYLLFLRPASQTVGDSFDGRRFSIIGIWTGSFDLVSGQVSISDAAGSGLRQMNGMTEVGVLRLVRNAVSH
jgi:hypothetical protein